MIDIEEHPLQPYLPQNLRVLFLGSFPPPRIHWSMDFFYPNYINDHWRIMGLIFFHNKDYFVDSEQRTFRLPLILKFLQEMGIGYYDAATSVRRLRDNASDKFLEIATATDIPSLVRPYPTLQVIATTGEKSCQTICNTLGLSELPKVGKHIVINNLLSSNSTSPILLWRLPSSSRAYPLALEKKASFYADMFQTLH